MKHLWLAVILGCGMAGGCAEVREEAAQTPAQSKMILAETKAIGCGDSAENLALDRLYPILGGGNISNYLDVWVSHDYSDANWKPRIAEQQKKLDDLREWARTLPDRCARNSYLGWVEYYQAELDSAKSELTTHANEKEMEDYNKEREQERQATKKFEQAVDGAFPEPPKKSKELQ